MTPVHSLGPAERGALRSSRGSIGEGSTGVGGVGILFQEIISK